MQLFVGPGVIPAPPWESVYRSRERLLFGEQTLKLREKLRSFDLHFEGDGHEPEDHIATELEFMGYLIQTTINAIISQDEEQFLKAIQTQFSLLEEHLLKWVPPFVEDILSSTPSSLYKGSALFLQDLIHEDYQYMNQLKEVLDYELV
nr:molecular chaperone TorD family protein [Bacillus sp. B15-48]